MSGLLAAPLGIVCGIASLVRGERVSFQNFQHLLFVLDLIVFVFFQRYLNKPSGNGGIYDPAEIHNRSELKGFLKEAMVKLGFHLISFFLYLYR